MDVIFLIMVLALIFLYYLIFHSRRRSYRHEKNQKTAGRIYLKLKTFETKGQQINYLKQINPYVFEELILFSLEKRGLKVIRNKRYSGDGGIDGRFYYNDTLFYVQAKRYKKHINKKHVVEFENIVSTNKVKGIFCHTGVTGKGSKEEFSKSSRVSFYSGSKLINLLFSEDAEI
jgi:restriction system protein